MRRQLYRRFLDPRAPNSSVRYTYCSIRRACVHPLAKVSRPPPCTREGAEGAEEAAGTGYIEPPEPHDKAKLSEQRGPEPDKSPGHWQRFCSLSTTECATMTEVFVHSHPRHVHPCAGPPHTDKETASAALAIQGEQTHDSQAPALQYTSHPSKRSIHLLEVL